MEMVTWYHRLIVFVVFSSVSLSVFAEEYCLPEVFHAECGAGELILMERAEFGRMELGRCVTRSYGHAGCSADVMHLFDRLCSGRTTCHVTVSDPVIVRTQPCPQDLASYLDATYRCIPVLPIKPDACHHHHHHPQHHHHHHQQQQQRQTTTGFQTILDAHGYIAATAAAVGASVESSPSMSDCVVVFQMLPGQRLNLTLMDFSAREDNPSPPPPLPPPSDSACSFQFAIVYEAARSASHVICSSTNQRRRSAVYRSRSHVVQMRLLPMGPPPAADDRLMLRFEVVACALPLLPNERYIFANNDYGRRKDEGDDDDDDDGDDDDDEDDVVVVCNSTQETFRLRCIDGKWTGQMMDCPSSTVSDLRVKSVDLNPNPKISGRFFSLTQLGISVTITASVSFVVVVYVSVLAACVLLLRRQRKRRRQQQQQQLKPSAIGYVLSLPVAERRIIQDQRFLDASAAGTSVKSDPVIRCPSSPVITHPSHHLNVTQCGLSDHHHHHHHHCRPENLYVHPTIRKSRLDAVVSSGSPSVPEALGNLTTTSLPLMEMVKPSTGNFRRSIPRLERRSRPHAAPGGIMAIPEEESEVEMMEDQRTMENSTEQQQQQQLGISRNDNETREAECEEERKKRERERTNATGMADDENEGDITAGRPSSLADDNRISHPDLLIDGCVKTKTHCEAPKQTGDIDL